MRTQKSRLSVLVLLLGLFVIMSAPSTRAQEVFSSGDGGGDTGGGGDETFSGGDNGDGGPGDDQFSGGDGGPCTGIDKIFNLGRCNPRPLPGYTKCGPYYNNYGYYVKTLLKHFPYCEVRGNQLWCRQMKAGMCNPSAGGRPDYPLVDSGMRLTKDCEEKCDFTVGRGNPPPPPPFPKVVTHKPVDIVHKPVEIERSPQPDPLGPCDMPPLEQLAQPPDDGDVAVAYALPPDDGDVAVAQSLPPDDGDIAIALALPSDTKLTGGVSGTKLTGGVSDTGTFTPPSRPTVLRGKTSINGWRMAPDQPTTLQGGVTQNVRPQKPIRLQGYAKKSLRVPVTYKPKHTKRSTVSPQTDTKIQLVLSGGTNTYSPEVGKQRCIEGFLQGMAAEMKQLTRYGEVEKAKNENKARKKQGGSSCEIKADPSPIFEDTIKHPDENPAGAGKFVMDMIEKVFKNNHDLAKAFPKLEKTLGFLGPLINGADFLHSYKETLETIVERDSRIRDAMDSSAGHDLDPRDVCYLAGQDAADAYNYSVKSLFSLIPEKPTIPVMH